MENPINPIISENNLPSLVKQTALAPVMQEISSLVGIPSKRVGHRIDMGLIPVDHLQWSMDEKFVLTSHGTTPLGTSLWDAQTGACLFTFQDTYGAQWTKDNKLIFTGCDHPKNSTKIWDAKAGVCLFTFQDTGYPCESWKEMLLTHNFNGVKIWNMHSGICLFTFSDIELQRLSADGKLLLLPKHRNAAEIWDMKTGTCIAILQERFSNTSIPLGWSKSGKFVYTTSQGNPLKIWDGTTGNCLAILQEDFAGTPSVEWSRDEKFIATTSEGKPVKVWETKTGTCLLTFDYPGFAQPRREALWSMDGKFILTVNHDTAKLWDAKTGKWVHTLEGSKSRSFPIDYCKWNPDGRLLLIVAGNTGEIWDVKTGNYLFSLSPSRFDYFRKAEWNSKGNLLVGSGDGIAKIWDMKNGNCLVTLSRHTRYVHSVSCNENRTQLLTNPKARLWDLNTGKPFFSLQMSSLTHWSKDKKLIFTLLHTSETPHIDPDAEIVKVWDAKTGDCIRKLYHDSLRGAQWPEDSNFILTFSVHTAKIWDVKANVCLTTIESEREICVVQLSKDKKFLAITTNLNPQSGVIYTDRNDYRTAIWNAETGQFLYSLQGSLPHWGDDYPWSESGKLVFTIQREGSEGPRINIWNVQTGQYLCSLKGMRDVNSAEWAQDRFILAADDFDGNARIWDVTTATCIHTLKHGSRLFYSAHWSKDGLHALTIGHDDYNIKIWNVETESCLFTLQGHTQEINSASFSEDGRFILTSGDDGTVRFWDAVTGELLLILHNLKEGCFLWESPPDRHAPFGRFWTNRTELIAIFERDEKTGEVRYLDQDDPQRKQYIDQYNSRLLVMSRLDPFKYQRLMVGLDLKKAGQMVDHLLGHNQPRRLPLSERSKE